MAFSVRAALAVLAALPIVVAAETAFPVRPITLVVPFAGMAKAGVPGFRVGT